MGELHLVVSCSMDCSLCGVAALFKEKALWPWIEMAKLSRPLSRVGRRFFYAWHMRTTAAHFSQQSTPKPLLNTRPLLAPGTGQQKAYVSRERCNLVEARSGCTMVFQPAGLHVATAKLENRCTEGSTA